MQPPANLAGVGANGQAGGLRSTMQGTIGRAHSASAAVRVFSGTRMIVSRSAMPPAKGGTQDQRQAIAQNTSERAPQPLIHSMRLASMG